MTVSSLIALLNKYVAEGVIAGNWELSIRIRAIYKGLGVKAVFNVLIESNHTDVTTMRKKLRSPQDIRCVAASELLDLS